MEQELKSLIRDIPDFPVPGIIFKDITPLLLDSGSFKKVIQYLVERYKEEKITKVVGIESRGFIFGAALAHELDAGFVPIRKAGKLPYDTIKADYELEYGTASMEIHKDAISEGERVVVIDDLLATGGTLSAACELIDKLGGDIVEVFSLIELAFLNGKEKLDDYKFKSLIVY